MWNGTDLIGKNSVQMRWEEFRICLNQFTRKHPWVKIYANLKHLLNCLILYTFLMPSVSCVHTTCEFFIFFIYFEMFCGWPSSFSADLLVCLRPISTLRMDVLGSRCFNFRSKHKCVHTHTHTHCTKIMPPSALLCLLCRYRFTGQLWAGSEATSGVL